MEQELQSLIEAWTICKSSHVQKDPNLYRNAFNYIENFKQTSAYLLEIGFYLATAEQQPQFNDTELTYFAIQLIIHAIKYKWNDAHVLNDHVKRDIRSKLFHVVFGVERFLNGPKYLRTSACLAMTELLKREWPQNWPTFLDELVGVCNGSTATTAHKCQVFVQFKCMAEEFLDMENIATTNLPTQRRRDINQYLTLHMAHIYEFFIENLQFFYAAQPPTNETIQLANICLEAFTSFIDWLSFEHLFSKNFLLINITLTLLNNEKMSLNAAKCLIALLNRKGSVDERKPLLGLFESGILTQILNCISANLKNKELTKYLIQILISMGFHLSALWSLPNFEDKPRALSIFLKALFELTFSPNKYFSFDAIQLWNNFLGNEYMRADEEVCGDFLVHFSAMITKSTLLFKQSFLHDVNSEFADDFDTEEDYLKFVQKYRSELSKLIRQGAAIKFESFIMNAHEWAVSIFKETSELSEENQLKFGYDSNSLLYLKWDALLYLLINVMQVAVRQIKQNQFKSDLEFQVCKEKTLSLLSMCVNIKLKNPNFCSFNLSILSSVISLSECYDPDVKTNIYTRVLEKLFDELNFFKSECVADNAQRSNTNLKFKFNVRRQLAAITLTMCRNYAPYFKSIFDTVLNKVFEIISCSYSSQMEKVILTQAIILASFQIYSTEMQTRLVTQLMQPIYEFFSSNEFRHSITSHQTFISFVGLNESNSFSSNESSSNEAIANRKKIFYFTNLYYGILKSIPENNNSTNSIGFNLQTFEGLILLLKFFNLVHSNELRNCVNQSILAMTEAAKATALGKEGSTVATTNGIANLQSQQQSDFNEPDKANMFFFNTYDTITQLIGIFMTKYKCEILLVPWTQTAFEVFSRLGEAMFTCFEQLPNFRLRSIVRYILKACLLTSSASSRVVENNFCVVKANEMFLEYFLPNVFSHISQTNRVLAESQTNNNNNEHDGSDAANLDNQVVEENQFTLMCREVCDLVKTFLFPPIVKHENTSTISPLSSTSSIIDNNSHMDDNGIIGSENDSEQMKSTEKDDTIASSNVLSEMAIALLKSNKNIYQSILLILFEGLTWPDSYCCTRFVRMGLTLFEKFPVSYVSYEETAAVASTTFSLFLNAQIIEHLFKCSLQALQVHGEHSELASLIMNLSFVVYEKSSSLIQDILNKNFVQIPNLNKKLLEEFLEKMRQINSVKENKVNSSHLNINSEKLKKDCIQLFKKIVQPIVGKSVGQLYKNEIKIKNLKPLNIMTKRKMAATNAMTHHDENRSETFNICSLFDPNL